MHTNTHLLAQTSSKRKKEQERSSALIEKLQEEKQRQEDNHRLVHSCIKQEKDSWFTASEYSQVIIGHSYLCSLSLSLSLSNCRGDEESDHNSVSATVHFPTVSVHCN